MEESKITDRILLLWHSVTSKLKGDYEEETSGKYMYALSLRSQYRPSGTRRIISFAVSLLPELAMKKKRKSNANK